MLISHSLSFQYNTSNHFEFPDIVLDRGENLLILGESGIGKTTLLHLLAGLLKPASGRIEVGGVDLTRLNGKELDRFRGSQVGIVFQKPYFIQSLTLGENLQMIQTLGRKSIDIHAIQLLLDELGLFDKIHSKTHRLSQGEQQRAAIALALVNRPALILADEPTSALDDKNCSKVIKLLKHQTAKYGASLLLITHDHRLTCEFENSVTLQSQNP
ncbi:ABC transporter ATP-binding protein [Algoriphagus sp. PAP.12]|uniref:ABC transporter ATP-binding protein n=1 Tax=Algoriphagus sp. PAP.12 TaxID=2996678 RepID=UPI00227ABC82|nr:ATP-binding cassette domain-containing protein [Algoriphagus sp. PAP.12]